jgi:hypothetical protein
MLTLYHNDMSTCAQKVRFALVEKGVSWESRHLDLRARDHQTPEYLRLNPNAVVPTIVHDGTVEPVASEAQRRRRSWTLNPICRALWSDGGKERISVSSTALLVDRLTAGRCRPPGEDSSDEALLGLVARGDKAAILTLFKRFNARIFRFLVRLVNNDALAEELLNQSAELKLA